ncbi:DUF5777 family beta-barrel protein [Rhodohalobacter mucosus]|uniref:DUF5777 domain-containing protein n=1 Tax=Rhodohalobacter mucosus TaxID=2079485 RepID=A0A316TXH0_9BACT|nr:DUF5777 family beta-barrel protein [Rhodohalobacter mucosus]PWN07352.1 hypothetical protein DDZ15_03550 [Rhodohalobacter mucosus]
MMKPLTVSIVVFLTINLIAPQITEAQLKRERAAPEDEKIIQFQAPVNIGISTVYNIPKGNLYTTIAHTFGLVNSGVEQFFGLDQGANTRLGLDYGVFDNLSVGIGRMTFNKVVDIRGKVHFLRQTESSSVPLSLAMKLSAAANTTPDIGLQTDERLSYLITAMIAKKIDEFSIQVSPMVSHFNTVAPTNPNQLYGIGILMDYNLSERYSLSAEYLPVIGNRNTGTKNTGAVAININTGGHVFQLYLSSSQWHNEQFIMANNRESFLEGDIRFGFNIHRTFRL